MRIGQCERGVDFQTSPEIVSHATRVVAPAAPSTLRRMSLETIELRSGQANVHIEPAGGRLARLSIDGLDLLVAKDGPDMKATRWGSFPMAPWAGRLPFGKLHFDGQDYEFPLTSPPHANHGVSHLQSWTVMEQSDARVVLSTPLHEPWPFGGTATQSFELADDELTVRIEIANDDRAMPALTGWHPWFRRQLDRGDAAQIDVSPSQTYELDDDMIPTGNLIDVPPPPWNETFVGLATPPVIRWPGALELEISSTFDHWVVFTEPEHAICVEPQSGPPNQVNTNPQLVTPGNPLTGSMTLRWTTET